MRLVDQVQRVHTVNQQVPHYPIWKVHKYNGINLKPLPVSVVPKYQPVQVSETVRQVPYVVQQPSQVVPPAPVPAILEQKVKLPVEQQELPTIEVGPETIISAKTNEEIQGIMKLLGISDPQQVPSIDEVMSVLGASTPEEAIETVKEIAATEEGVDLIKSFIESRQAPEEEFIIDVTTQTPPSIVVVEENVQPLPPPPPPSGPIHSFWKPNILTKHTAKVASSLDQAHTNVHLLERMMPNNRGPTTASTFQNTWRNLRNFFTFQDNTPVPLETYNNHPNNNQRIVEQKPKSSTATVVYINEPIPSTSVNLPPLPQLSPLPDLPGVVGTIPSVPKIPQIQLPSHFSIPKRVVQGPYMKVKYPVSSLAPLSPNRQFPLYTYQGQQIGSAPLKSSYEVPVYGPPAVKSQIPFSQSTKDAFKGAPKIISSLPVPSLPYTFEEQEEDQLSGAGNAPIEAVALPEVDEEEIRGKAARKVTVGGGPQRLSGYEAYATGKVHRATNVDIVQSRLTNGSANSEVSEVVERGGEAAEESTADEDGER